MFEDHQNRLQASHVETRWYAVYVCANHENRVAEQFGYRSVEHFLPRYESLHRWKDRKIRLSLPLFPGYVFVRLALRDRLQILKVPSVVRLVEFNGIPAALPDAEIELLQRALAQGIYAEPRSYLTVGREVRVVRGPLEGMKGILLRKKNSARVVISIDLIRRSISVEIDPAMLEPVQ
jgi:transcription antitermination factor NusG